MMIIVIGCNTMAILLLILLSSFALSFQFSASKKISTLTEGSSLTIQDVLVSKPEPIFTAGFFSVGENAYCFAIWFTDLYDSNFTVVWMANRDQPINGRYSKLSLKKTGNLVLTDAGQLTIWTSDTMSNSTVQLQLHDKGNLVLTTLDGEKLWQSFDSPTDTLLPQQLLTENTNLVSSRSLTNYSSGFYKLYFDYDNILRLLYNDPEITSVFWPDPWLNSWDAGRYAYNNTKIALLDSLGSFQSSDGFSIKASDFGIGPQRRLTLDVDGNLRVYSLNKVSKSWEVSWQANPRPCQIYGICGYNSLCTYDHATGRKCTCLPGYKKKSQNDWSYGCEPDFDTSCNNSDASIFLQLPHVEFFGYDISMYSNYTLEKCESLCLQYCDCKGFQYKFDPGNGYYNCYPKTTLTNGYQAQDFQDPMYIRLPKAYQIKPQKQDQDLQCSSGHITELERTYDRNNEHGWLKSLLWSTCAVGAFEVFCLLAYFYKTQKSSNSTKQGYLQVATGFRRFSYAELKKATRNFSEEIGRGGGGIVYKGTLSDKRVAAMKCLKEASGGEAEFLAELSTIGKLNHMNLIEIWGFCAERKHRLLVYEYMEHGSLAHNLHSNKLDWKMRCSIVVGIAKGLKYLHEECLEWVLHCDVKPQNILLNEKYKPKVADFGLSRLVNRGNMKNSSFSKIRGTRGYMAPEWIFNLPITSKVDVYSYGIVVLEIITGKCPVGGQANGGGNELEPRRLVNWAREKMQNADERELRLKETVDALLNGEFDMEKMEILVQVALQCAEEERDQRPSMSQVVDILLHSNIFE